MLPKKIVEGYGKVVGLHFVFEEKVIFIYGVYIGIKRLQTLLKELTEKISAIHERDFNAVNQTHILPVYLCADIIRAGFKTVYGILDHPFLPGIEVMGPSAADHKIKIL